MPSVVLPEPDSPTMPSVSPRRSCSAACRTAAKLRLSNQPRAIENVTPTSFAASRIGASPASGCTSRCGRLASSLRV